MDRYSNKEVLQRRKRRFQHWLKHYTSHKDREVLRRLAFNDLMKTCGKSVKYSNMTNRMFEIYEDYLAGKAPILKKYLDKKYERIS